MNAIERRKNERVSPEKIIAVDIITDKEARLGILTNINAEGLCFRYVGWGAKSVIESNKLCTLALHELGGKTLVENFPAKVIADRYRVEQSKHSLLELNQCCIQFDNPPEAILDIVFDQKGSSKPAGKLIDDLSDTLL